MTGAGGSAPGAGRSPPEPSGAGESGGGEPGAGRPGAGEPGPSESGARPRIAGRRLTDVSALAGGAVWLSLVAGSRVGALSLSAIDRYVALATLVLVPLGLGLVDPGRGATRGPTPTAAGPYRIAAIAQLPAALAVVASLAAPRGSLPAIALAVPWLGVTAAVALSGVGRLRSRGGGPVPELAIDAAFAYVPVAAVFLLLHAAGITLGFAPVIVLLTGVHFHYAGFVLPLVVGLTGRLRASEDGGVARRLAPDEEDGLPKTAADRPWTVVTVAIVLGIAAVAVGITISPLLEVVAAVGFPAAVVTFALLVLATVVPSAGRVAGALLAVASLSVCVTMALALAFAYGQFPGTGTLVTIPEMVRWHGSVNAFGFALPSLLALRLLGPGSR